MLTRALKRGGVGR